MDHNHLSTDYFYKALLIIIGEEVAISNISYYYFVWFVVVRYKWKSCHFTHHTIDKGKGLQLV